MITEKSGTIFRPELIRQAINYQAYRQMINDLLEKNQTTGPNQSQAYIDYTKINVQRMKRWDKTGIIAEELKQELTLVNKKWIWLVLTEAWCGDAAQNIPMILKMAEINPNIKVKFLFRDENPELMDLYLTNGGRSIPKLIALRSDTLTELGNWGPRPAFLQDMVMTYRKNPTEPYASFTEKLHKWYADNKSRDLQNEFLALVRQWRLNA